MKNFCVLGFGMKFVFLIPVAKIEMRFDNVIYLLENRRSPLLPVLFNINAEFCFPSLFDESCLWGGYFPFQFIPSHLNGINRVQDVDSVDAPAYLRFPINCRQNACRRSHHFIGNAFRLQLRASETGVITPYAQFKTFTHFLIYLITMERIIIRHR